MGACRTEPARRTRVAGGKDPADRGPPGGPGRREARPDAGICDPGGAVAEAAAPPAAASTRRCRRPPTGARARSCLPRRRTPGESPAQPCLGEAHAGPLRAPWEAGRVVITADGEAGKAWGDENNRLQPGERLAENKPAG